LDARINAVLAMSRETVQKYGAPKTDILLPTTGYSTSSYDFKTTITKNPGDINQNENKKSGFVSDTYTSPYSYVPY